MVLCLAQIEQRIYGKGFFLKFFGLCFEISLSGKIHQYFGDNYFWKVENSPRTVKCVYTTPRLKGVPKVRHPAPRHRHRGTAAPFLKFPFLKFPGAGLWEYPLGNSQSPAPADFLLKLQVNVHLHIDLRFGFFESTTTIFLFQQTIFCGSN